MPYDVAGRGHAEIAAEAADLAVIVASGGSASIESLSVLRARYTLFEVLRNQAANAVSLIEPLATPIMVCTTSASSAS